MRVEVASSRIEKFTGPAVKRLQEITETAGVGIAEQASSVAKSRGINGADVEVTGSDVSKGYENWLRLGTRRGSFVLKAGNILMTVVLMFVPTLYGMATEASGSDWEALWLLALVGFSVVGVVGLTIITINVRT